MKSKGAIIFGGLFGLAFAIPGFFVLYIGLSMAWRSLEAHGWDPVQATILSADLVTSSGGDSTTYRVQATYEYRVFGERYESDAVTLSTGSDNIGSFHQDAYRELARYRDSGDAFTAWVDPDEPSRSVLYRNLRWGLFAFTVIFGLVFSLVGCGVMAAVIWGSRLQGRHDSARADKPEEPWKWREDWKTGRITSTSRPMTWFVTGFAVLWSLISAPAALFVPEEIANGNQMAWLALIFPLVGLGLLSWAGYLWAQRFKFGESTLELNTLPAQLGSRLTGRINTSTRLPSDAPVRLTLTCVRSERRGDNRTDRVLWQDSRPLHRGSISPGPRGTSVPVDIQIPRGVGPSSDPDATDPVRWMLEVNVDLQGVDYAADFEVPVFGTASASAGDSAANDDDAHVQSAFDGDVHIQPPFGAAGDVLDDGRALESAGDGSPADELQLVGSRAPTPAELRGHGVTVDSAPTGGVRYTFARARNKGVAISLTLFETVWLGAVWLLFRADGPWLMRILFVFFGVLLLWFVFELWLARYVIEVRPDRVRFKRQMLGPGRWREMPRDEIAAIAPVRGMQSGTKLYYRIQLTTTGDKDHIVATGLESLWLAQHLSAALRAA